jgi:molybdate-binding protein
VRGGDGYYRVSLFRRTQGLMLRPGGGVRELADLARGEVRLADRQAMSGTRLLADRLLAGAGVDLPPGRRVGPFSTHLELALAVLNRQADAGFGSQWAAERCGLKFLPLHDEVFALVLPVALASRPRLAAFLEAVLGHVRGVGARGLAGYAFDVTGRMETLGLRLTAEGARR